MCGAVSKGTQVHAKKKKARIDVCGAASKGTEPSLRERSHLHGNILTPSKDKFYTKNGEDSLFFCDFFKSVDKLSELAGRNAETHEIFPLTFFLKTPIIKG